MGVTVERLKSVYNLNAFGVDPSLKLLELGKEKYGNHQYRTRKRGRITS